MFKHTASAFLLLTALAQGVSALTPSPPFRAVVDPGSNVKFRGVSSNGKVQEVRDDWVFEFEDDGKVVTANNKNKFRVFVPDGGLEAQCEATGTRTGNSKERKIHFKHKYFPLITSQLQNMDCGCRDGITMKCWYEVNDRDKGAIKKDIGCRNPEPQCK